MSNPIWQRFSSAPKLRSLDMKDRVQEQVMAETRGATSAELVAYFREASRRFWREFGRSESAASPMVVRDADRPPRSE